jgi:hypothetical protein
VSGRTSRGAGSEIAGHTRRQGARAGKGAAGREMDRAVLGADSPRWSVDGLGAVGGPVTTQGDAARVHDHVPGRSGTCSTYYFPIKCRGFAPSVFRPRPHNGDADIRSVDIRNEIEFLNHLLTQELVIQCASSSRRTS